jgi:hypothetical protein
MDVVEDPRYGRVRSTGPPPQASPPDYRNYVTQQYETPYEQVTFLLFRLFNANAKILGSFQI